MRTGKDDSLHKHTKLNRKNKNKKKKLKHPQNNSENFASNDVRGGYSLTLIDALDSLAVSACVDLFPNLKRI